MKLEDYLKEVSERAEIGIEVTYDFKDGEAEQNILCPVLTYIPLLLEIVRIQNQALEYYSGLFGFNDDGIGVATKSREALQTINAKIEEVKR